MRLLPLPEFSGIISINLYSYPEITRATLIFYFSRRSILISNCSLVSSICLKLTINEILFLVGSLSVSPHPKELNSF